MLMSWVLGIYSVKVQLHILKKDTLWVSELFQTWWAIRSCSRADSERERVVIRFLVAFRTNQRWRNEHHSKQTVGHSLIQLLPGGFSKHTGFRPGSDECVCRWRCTWCYYSLDFTIRLCGPDNSRREAAVDIVSGSGCLGMNGFTEFELSDVGLQRPCGGWMMWVRSPDGYVSKSNILYFIKQQLNKNWT